MGQVVTKDIEMEPNNYNEINNKFKDLLDQLNASCKDVGVLRVYYHGNFIKTDTLMYFYISCMYLDNNSHIEEELIHSCNTIFTLVTKTLDDKTILNPHIEKYISNIVSICSNLCSAIPNCKSLSYNLISMQSITTIPHPIGYTIVLYPIIN